MTTASLAVYITTTMVNSDVKRDAFASILGLALAALSIWLLRDGILPWYGGAGGVLVGLYLTLPNRMRVVGQSLFDYFKESR